MTKEKDMTPRPDMPFADISLMLELTPLATALEAEVLSGQLPEEDAGAPMEAIVDEAPEAALAQEIAPLPDDLMSSGSGAVATAPETPGDVDEYAALQALKAADIDLTGIDLAKDVDLLSSNSADSMTGSRAVEVAANTEAQATSVGDLPLMCMGFGSPGTPVPKDFDPTTFVTDPGLIDGIRQSLVLAEGIQGVEFEGGSTADSDAQEPPPWPFEGKDIPEVR